MEGRKQNCYKICLVKWKKNLILYVERVGDIVVSLQQDTLAYNSDYPKALNYRSIYLLFIRRLTM